ncbi:erythrocyte band 7 integral membrane protein, partial [Leptonychotes weddellii]|uniref:Erythrocyte band 7 integral membrane protein n=1 Tax=Leptonychotes weddellii TaxID=9713 RepID=A0A7F8R1F7_LEPWE
GTAAWVSAPGLCPGSPPRILRGSRSSIVGQDVRAAPPARAAWLRSGTQGTPKPGGSRNPGSYLQNVYPREDLLRHQYFTEDSPSAGLGPCGWILVAVSFLFTVITLPISIWMCIKIIKEYERAIIFRLGRILQGGAKGPGLFFVLPCTDSFIKVDMRTISFDIPPQEVR